MSWNAIPAECSKTLSVAIDFNLSKKEYRRSKLPEFRVIVEMLQVRESGVSARFHGPPQAAPIIAMKQCVPKVRFNYVYPWRLL